MCSCFGVCRRIVRCNLACDRHSSSMKRQQSGHDAHYANTHTLSLLALLYVLCTALPLAVHAAASASSSPVHDPIAWNELTPVTLAGLTAADFASATGNDLSVIPWEACTAFKGEQFAAINNGSCSGFQGKCVSVIGATVFQAMNSDCMTNFNPNALADATSDAISQIPPFIMPYLTSAGLRLMSGGCRGITDSQLAQIGVTTNTCSTMNANCFSAINATVIPSLQAACLFATPASAFTLLSSLQVSNFTAAIVSHLTLSQLHSIDGAACGGFSALQLAGLESDSPFNTCAGFTSECIAAIAPTQLAQGAYGISENCIKNIVPSAFAGMTSAQIAQLSTSLVQDISSSQFQRLDPTVCVSFTAPQVAVFGSTFPSACEGVQSACWRAMDSTVFPSITPPCVLASNATAFDSIGQDQLKGLSVAAVATLTAAQVASFVPESCAGFLSSQIQVMNVSCAGISEGCSSHLSTDSLATISNACIQLIPAPSWAGWSAPQIAAIPSALFGSVNASQISFVRAESCKSFSRSYVEQFSTGTQPEMCQGLKADCVAAIPSSSFAAFAPICVSVSPSNFLSLVNADQISQLSPSSSRVLSAPQFAALDGASCAGFFPNASVQFGMGATDVGFSCSGLQSGCLQRLSSASVEQLQPSCVSFVAAQQFASLDAQQIAALSLQAAAALTGPQMSLLRNSSCFGFSSAQVGVFSPAACGGARKDCWKFMQPPSFGLLTPTCIAAARVDAFEQVDAQQFAQFPIASLSALSASQLSSFIPSTCTAFNRTRVAALSAPTCEGFTSANMLELSVDAVSGFSGPCVSHLPASSFPQLDGAKFAAIDPTAVAFISAEQIASLLPTTYLSILPAQVAQFGVQSAVKDMCKGVSAEGVRLLSDAALKSIKGDCVDFLLPTVFREMNPRQVASLTPAALSHLLASQISALQSNSSLSSCSGFSSEDVALFGTGSAAASTLCSAVNSTCFSQLSSSISGLQAACVQRAPATAFSMIDSKQIALVPAATITAFSAAQLELLTPLSCVGFNRTQIAALDSSSCEGLNEGCLLHLRSEVFSAMQPLCAAKIKPQAMAALSKEDIKALSTEVVAILSAEQLNNLDSAVCAAFSAPQVAAFGTTTNGACSGLRDTCFQALNADVFSSLSSTCIGSAAANAFALLNDAQVAALTPAAVASLTRAQMVSFSSAGCAGFDNAQTQVFGSVSGDMCAGINSTCWTQLTELAVSGLQAACIMQVQPPLFDVWSGKQLKQFSVGVISAITTAQSSFLRASSCVSFTETQSASFGGPLCGGLSGTCFSVLSDAALQRIDGSCLGQLQPSTLDDLNQEQVALLQPTSMSALTAPQLNLLTTQCGGFSSAQLGQIKNVCAAFAVDCVHNIPSASCVGFTGTCVAGISDATILALSLVQLQQFTLPAIQAITPTQFVALAKSYGALLVNSFDMQQGNSLAPSTLLLAKQMVDNGTLVLSFESFTTHTNFSLISAAQLALAGPDTEGLQFLFATPANARSLQAESWSGLRSKQMQAIGTTGGTINPINDAAKETTPAAAAASVYGNIAWLNNPLSFTSMQSDALSSISAAQLAVLSPSLFTSFPLDSLSPSAFPALSAAQMQEVPLSEFSGLSCTQWGSFNSAQKGALLARDLGTYNALEQKCGLALSSTAQETTISSTAAADASSTAQSEQSSSSTGGAAPTPEEPSHSGLSGAEIGGIIGGSVAFVVALIALMYYCKKHSPVGGAPFTALLGENSGAIKTYH